MGGVSAEQEEKMPLLWGDRLRPGAGLMLGLPGAGMRSDDRTPVRSRRTGAADEITATGSAVLLRVKLPDGVKADRVKKVKVYSKGYGLGNVTQVSLPLQSDILPKQNQP